jgi:hypothetical protein
MHFHFTAAEIIWTLTFAALLVLLVVLLGRDRVARYPFFTAGAVLATVEMLTRRLLADKLPPLTSTKLFLALADIGVVITLLVAIELARRAFARARPLTWVAGTIVVVAADVVTLWRWGPWPARQTLLAHSLLAHLRLMQLGAEKGDLFNNLLFVALTLIAVFTGRRFHPGWRSHARQLLLAYSAGALMQVAVRILWEKLAKAGPPRSAAEFNHRTLVQTRLLEANSIVFGLVIVAWIVCLWFDEPSSAPALEPASPEEPTPPEDSGDSSPVAAALRRAIGPDAGKPPSANRGSGQ